MSRPEPARLRQLLATLFARAMADHRVAAEAHRARREFFGVDGDDEQPAARELRFVEWLLLERESVALGAVPVEVFGDDDEFADLKDSRASVYRLRLETDGTVLAEDVQADDGEPVELTQVGGALRDGDLLVGRLFPLEAVAWLPSPAVAIYRPGDQLAAALRRDFARLDLDRPLSQVELEHLLLHRHGGEVDGERTQLGRPIERVEADLEQLLTAADRTHDTTGISEQLRVAVRPGVVIGPILETLAFETDVELEAVRRLLLELWNAHHEGGEPMGSAAVLGLEAAAAEPTAAALPPPPPGIPLGEHLVRALDAGLAAHEDVEELFGRLEQMAGIEPEADDDDEDAAAARLVEAVAGAEPFGNLGPLVQEFLWETDRAESELARSLALFVQVQNNAALPQTDLEQLGSKDVMRVLLHVYLAAPAARRAATVRSTFDAIKEFFAWAEATQGIALAAVLDGCRGPLLDQLDRIDAASQALSAAAPPQPGNPPAILRIDDLAADGFGVLKDDEPHWVAAEGETVRLLRTGDVLLAALIVPDASESQGQLAGTVVVLPADAEALIG